jgi:hypothetical protein
MLMKFHLLTQGHDVLALAQLGFQSWGIDISETAINYAHE